MAVRKSFDPYPYVLITELVILIVYLFGGLLFLIFGIQTMTFAEVFTFLLAWFSLFLSITCVSFLIILPFREIHILIQEKRAEFIGEDDE